MVSFNQVADNDESVTHVNNTTAMNTHANYVVSTQDAKKTVNSLSMLDNDDVETGRVVIDSDDSSSISSSSASSTSRSNSSDNERISPQQH